MNSRILVIASGASAFIVVSAASSANIISAPNPAQNHQPSIMHAGSSGRAKASHSTNVSAPSGCSQNGPVYFLGLPNANDYAGGASSRNGLAYWAGVAAGYNNESCDTGSLIGAGQSNTIGGDSSSSWALIGAGLMNTIEQGQTSFIGGGMQNSIGDSAYGGGSASAIAGGQDNAIGTADSFIGAGSGNQIVATTAGSNGAYDSFIGAGSGNVVTNYFATIGGGNNNSVSGSFGVIGGGAGNEVSGSYSVNGGGYDNQVSGSYSTAGGGYGNVLTGTAATVAGGYENSASGRNAAIPGGAYDLAGGVGAFAAGYRANAANQGTFVWNDDDGSSLASTASNQFLARASGGFYLYTSTGLTTGVKLAPGSGSWSTLSDRAVKTGIRSVDEARILAKIASMPVSEWSYSAQGLAVRHLGPMAQDFHAAFGLGEDERHISTVDEEGVALAAIKALQRESLAKDQVIAKIRADKDRQIADLRAEKDRQIAELRSTEEARFAAMERRMAALESRNASR